VLRPGVTCLHKKVVRRQLCLGAFIAVPGDVHRDEARELAGETVGAKPEPSNGAVAKVLHKDVGFR
jgi:hypothetical protein